MTLPNVRWALLYGVLLCNARAMGEFGAVSVVSGHIRGETNTMPLHVEILYNEYNFAAAFAVASLLALLALVTLALKSFLEARHGAELARLHTVTEGTCTMEIRIEDINKHFGGFPALNDVDLDIADGELIALLGPSGSRQDHAAAHHRRARVRRRRPRAPSAARTWPRAPCASATSVSCSSTTRCSST